MKGSKQILYIWVFTLLIGGLFTILYNLVLGESKELNSNFHSLLALSLVGCLSMLVARSKFNNSNAFLYYRSMLRVLLGSFVFVFIGIVAMKTEGSDVLRFYFGYCSIAWFMIWYFLRRKMI